MVGTGGMRDSGMVGYGEGGDLGEVVWEGGLLKARGFCR
jgi:hypothetical protein